MGMSEEERVLRHIRKGRKVGNVGEGGVYEEESDEDGIDGCEFHDADKDGAPAGVVDEEGFWVFEHCK